MAANDVLRTFACEGEGARAQTALDRLAFLHSRQVESGVSTNLEVYLACVGPQTQRDYAYHQGTAWPWIGGFYMEACLKIYKRTRLSFIERQMVGYEDEMVSHCIGTIPELFDGNPPFHGRGAISFAMNVAEILRTLELLEKYKY